MDLIGAIDIGGTKISAGLVGLDGVIVEQETWPTDREKDVRDVIERIRGLLARWLERRPQARLCGVGVGSTGPVDPNNGVLGPNSFLSLWEGIPLVELMEDAFGVPVAFENDADAAALGEFAWGAGQGARVCAYVTVSTGIGCGVVLDGRLYRGAGGAHPELGHIIIDASSGPLCICGGRGCWESLASGTGLAAWYNEQIRQQSPSSIEEVDAREVCRRAGLGEPLAQEAVLRGGHYLGIGLANLITTFIPDVIVLGGGMMASWELFEEQVRAVIRETCGMVPYQRTKLCLASLGGRVGLAGAARVWLHRYGDCPAA